MSNDRYVLTLESGEPIGLAYDEAVMLVEGYCCHEITQRAFDYVLATGDYNYLCNNNDVYDIPDDE